MHNIWRAVLILGLQPSAFAATSVNSNHLGTQAQQAHAREWNRRLERPLSADPTARQKWDVLKPFSEIETSGFVAISGDDNFELPGLRQAIAENLPKNTTLVIYVGDSAQVPDLKSAYGKFLNSDQLKFLVVPTTGSSDTVWARDSLPFPVYLKSSTGKPTFGLVDSLYPQSFEPDAAFAKAMSLPETSTGEYFRGGNLLIDAQNNCYSENVNETAGLNDPETYFKTNFGCATVTLLDQEGGIGDIDERIKFLTGQDVLTDNDRYATILKAKGYHVHRIPTTGDAMETYMNTLFVNGTFFVPQMDIARDQDALKAYTDLGFKAVGVYTKTMADEGNGNIHCVTMNYPVGTFVASPEGSDFVQFAR